jgi:hypothetical protein
VLIVSQASNQNEPESKDSNFFLLILKYIFIRSLKIVLEIVREIVSILNNWDKNFLKNMLLVRNVAWTNVI